MKQPKPEGYIKMEKVESSNIFAIGYLKKDKLMKVKFNNGLVYSYTPVTLKNFNKVLKADSVGKEFNKLIKSDKSLTVEKMT